LLATSGVVYWAETVSAEFEAKFPTADCFPYARDDAIFYDKNLPETWAFTSSLGELSMADDPRGIRLPVRGVPLEFLKKISFRSLRRTRGNRAFGRDRPVWRLQRSYPFAP
jgi:hypothetical protein